MKKIVIFEYWCGIHPLVGHYFRPQDFQKAFWNSDTLFLKCLGMSITSKPCERDDNHEDDNS